MFNPIAFLKPRAAHAHCDIPCGIYDPVVAKMAAQTVQKMVLRMQNLEAPQPGAPAGERQAFANTFSRIRNRQGRARREVQGRVAHPLGRLRLAQH